MKILFCLTDIHSFYDKAMEALNKQGFDIDNEDHILVVCGDLLDRGPDAEKCLEFVNSVPEDRKILIIGNHEDLLVEALDRGRFWAHDVRNGTVDTVAQLSGIPYEDIMMSELTAFGACDKVKNIPSLKQYLESCVDYAVVGEYVFVHGWIPARFKDGMPITALDRNNGDWKDGDWENARWLNGMAEWKWNRLTNKTIVCGHCHCSWGHAYLHNDGVEFADEYYVNDGEKQPVNRFDPFIDDGIIAFDSCVAYSEEMYCVKLEVGDEEWQSRTLGNTMSV